MSWRAATWADVFAVVSGWSATLGPLPADTKGDISSLEEQISTLRSFGDSWMLLVTGECLTPHSHPKVSQHSLRSFCLYFYYFIHYCLTLIVLMLIHYILLSSLFSPDWYILSISPYSTLSTSPLHLCHNYNTPALIAEATVNPYSSHKLYSVVDFAILSIFSLQDTIYCVVWLLEMFTSVPDGKSSDWHVQKYCSLFLQCYILQIYHT